MKNNYMLNMSNMTWRLKLEQFLMMRIETVLETLVYSPFSHLIDATASPRIFYWMQLKFIVRKIIILVHVQVVTIGLPPPPPKKKQLKLFERSPREFHLISYHSSKPHLQTRLMVVVGGVDVTWYNIVKPSGTSDSRFAPLLIAREKVDHYER